MGAALVIPKAGLWTPRGFDFRRLLRPLRMDGQFAPYQPMQFLSGLLGKPPGLGISVPLSSITYQTFARADASDVLTVPGTAQAGDFALLHAVDNTGAGALVNPSGSGWTQILLNGTNEVLVSGKILVSGDISASVDFASATPNESLMFIFRGNVAFTSFTAGDWETSGIMAGNPAAQTCSATGGTPPLIVVGYSRVNNGTAAFSTASPAFDGTQATADADLLGGYKIYDSSPADHSIDQNDLGNGNCLTSGYVQFT